MGTNREPHTGRTLKTSNAICNFYNERILKQAAHIGDPQNPSEPQETEDNDDENDTNTEANIQHRVYVCTEDKNPDIDIKPTNEYTLSLATTEAQPIVLVHGPEGDLVGQLAEDKTTQRWHRYNIAKERGQHLNTDGTFPEELYMLLKRYNTRPRGDASATCKVKMTNHWTLPT